MHRCVFKYLLIQYEGQPGFKKIFLMKNNKVSCFRGTATYANMLKSDASSTFVVQRQKAIIKNAECKYIEI